MTAVLRTLQENFGPRDEIRGYRPAALTNRRWFLGQDSRKVFAVSLLNETVDPTQSTELDQDLLAGVVAPLVPGDTSGTHLIHVLGSDGMVTTLSTTTLAQVGTWTASGEAQTVGALAVGDYGIYAGGAGGIKYYNQETGQAQWAVATGLGWIKWLAVCRDTPDVIYALDEGGRWGVFACDGVQIWAVPTAALDPIPDVINVMTDADYLTSAATGLAVLAKGPRGKGQVTFVDLSSPQEPTISAVSSTYAEFGQTGITGAVATDRPLTQDDADAFPEIPWWAATAFAALRGPALGDALDGFVALDGMRRAWLTTEPTTAPAGASPYPAPEPEWPEIGPTCSLTVTETETTAATVAGTCAWQTARDVGPGSGVVSGGSSSVAIAAPGVATIPLSLGVNSLVLTVTDARGATATANDSVRRRTPNPWPLTISSGGILFTSELGFAATDYLERYRKGLLADPLGGNWKLVLCKTNPAAAMATATDYASIASYEMTGGAYPTGGVAIAPSALWSSPNIYTMGDQTTFGFAIPQDLLGGIWIEPGGRVAGCHMVGARTFYSGATIADLYGGTAASLFFSAPAMQAASVSGWTQPTSSRNTKNWDAAATVTLRIDACDAGDVVIRSTTATAVAGTDSNYSVTTLSRQYAVTASIPLYTTDPAIASVKIIVTSPPLVRTDTPENVISTEVVAIDPSVYTSINLTGATFSMLLPGYVP